MHERYISYDTGRKKYRVELRISKGKSVSKRVDTLEEARELREQWLQEREALAHQPLAAEQKREDPKPAAKSTKKKRTVFYDSDPEDDRNIPRVHLRKDYPAEAEDAFTVVFD
jgi:plasmid stabilization system protein ParE